MGYTHYWRIHEKMNPETFASFAKDCEALAKISNIPIANGSGDKGTDPLFSDDLISFNGVENDSHETFYITVDDVGFNFCKTATKPYDVLVTACLILFKYYFSKVEVSSDGDKEDWKMGIELFKKVFPNRGIGIGFLK